MRHQLNKELPFTLKMRGILFGSSLFLVIVTYILRGLMPAQPLHYLFFSFDENSLLHLLSLPTISLFILAVNGKIQYKPWAYALGTFLGYIISVSIGISSFDANMLLYSFISAWLVIPIINILIDKLSQ
jgi:hypothetical protein